jgi:hypothetical protein
MGPAFQPVCRYLAINPDNLDNVSMSIQQLYHIVNSEFLISSPKTGEARDRSARFLIDQIVV